MYEYIYYLRSGDMLVLRAWGILQEAVQRAGVQEVWHVGVGGQTCWQGGAETNSEDVVEHVRGEWVLYVGVDWM